MTGPVTRTRSSRVLRGAALAVAGLVLAGCTGHPGSAAVVGDESIDDTRVDEVATALCAAQGTGGQGQGQDLATRAARQGALDVLISSAVTRAYAESEGVQADQEQVSALLASSDQGLQGLSEQDRTAFRETLREVAEARLALTEIGRAELASQGVPEPTEEQALSTGTQLQSAWADKNVDIEVDPRYGVYAQGALRAATGSLSVAQSDSAVDGEKATPSTSWVSSLPASQKCAS